MAGGWWGVEHFGCIEWLLGGFWQVVLM